MRLLVIDSGIGGLNVLRSLAYRLENADLYYLSDSANAPYGTKSEEFLFSRAEKLLDGYSVGMDGVIFACNTLTVTCLDKLKDEYPVPLFGVRPEEPCDRSLLICTERTAKSDWIKRAASGKSVDVVFPDGLVSRIEKNAKAIICGDYSSVEDLLPPDRGYKEVALGCTHFLYLEDLAKSIYKKAVVKGVSVSLYSSIYEKFRETRGNVTRKKIDSIDRKIVFLGDDKIKNCDIFSLLNNK